MAVRQVVFAWTAFMLASAAPPAVAQDWYDGAAEVWYDRNDQWRATHSAIYRLRDSIAYLEANPDIDDAYKGPIISGARADIRRLRSTLPPASWHWASPCCYSRKPIHIR